jgi:hypothetical protein
VHFPHSLWSQFTVKIQSVHFLHSLCIFLSLWSQFAVKIQSVHFPHSLWSQCAVKIQSVHFPHSLWSQFAKKITICAFSSQSVHFPYSLWSQFAVKIQSSSTDRGPTQVGVAWAQHPPWPTSKWNSSLTRPLFGQNDGRAKKIARQLKFFFKAPHQKLTAQLLRLPKFNS